MYLPIPIIASQEYSCITYDGRYTLNQKAKIMIKTPISILLECDCYIDPSIKYDFYHILLEINFQDHFTSYETKLTQITLIK